MMRFCKAPSRRFAAVMASSFCTTSALPLSSSLSMFAAASSMSFRPQSSAPAASPSSSPPSNISGGASVVTPAALDFAKEVLAHRLTSTHPAGRHLTVYVDSEMIAWVVMNRAGRSANALGEEFMKDLNTAFDLVEDLVTTKRAQFAILTSAKTTFCVGADIEFMYPVTDPVEAKMLPAFGHQSFSRIESFPFPVVAAINGLALGGGFELALACHHRAIAATAKVGFPECMLGLLPGGGGTVRTQRLCGLVKTVQWIMSSQQVKAPAAVKAGACDVLLPDQARWAGEVRFFEEVRRWAARSFSDKAAKPSKGRRHRSLMDRVMEDTSFGRQKVADETIKTLNKKTKGKYMGQYKALECVMYAATRRNEQGFEKECANFAELLCTPEAKNQMALYFLTEEMKKMDKKVGAGVSKDKIPQIKKIGVIGAGVMGSGIVHFFANENIPVAVKDVKQEAVDKGVDMVRGLFQESVKKKKMDKEGLEAKMGLVTGGTTDEVFRGVDLVIEAAVEVMDIKKKIIQQLEADGVIHGKNIFSTNTSSLSLTEMQTVSKYPANIVGMHFFNPVGRMPLVEVIMGDKTSPEAAAAVFQLALKSGKKPIIVKDGPGFLVNRILGAYMAEAGRLVVEEHCDVAKVDEAIVNFGMPMGPFRLLDEVGLDVSCHVGPTLRNGLKSDRFDVAGEIQKMMEDGYLGRKNGRGFYTYSAADHKGGEQLNREVVGKYFGQDLRASLSEKEIVDRCVLLMVNEAAMILHEGKVQSPEDVDIGMIFGTGFPPYRGGLLQYADHRGIDHVVETLQQLQAKTGKAHFAPHESLVKMAQEKKRFFPNRPFVPYVERHGYPKIFY